MSNPVQLDLFGNLHGVRCDPYTIARALKERIKRADVVTLRDLQDPHAWSVPIREGDDLREKATEAVQRAGKFGVMIAYW